MTVTSNESRLHVNIHLYDLQILDSSIHSTVLSSIKRTFD